MEKIITLKDAQEIKFQKAVEKGYSKIPSYHSFKFLIHRLRQELCEYEHELFSNECEGNWQNRITFELADVKNILWFIEMKHNREITGETM